MRAMMPCPPADARGLRALRARHKIRGTTCAKALSAARFYGAKTNSPAPWMCLLGHGERYRNRVVDFVCAYGGKRGNVRNWPHALIVTR
jgi:hypothetical protein